MQAPVDELRPYLQAFDFQNLLVEGLGWDYYRTEQLNVRVDGHDYALNPAAQKAGFAVYVCGPGADGSVPPYPARRKIERQVVKLAYEHLIIFVDADKTLQVWQWVKREAGKPDACREQQYRAGQTGAPILQRLQSIAFSLDEEAGLTVPLVASRVSKALDVERVTKRFYDRFRAELATFQGFIDGITAQGDREWYASLMLNRMMFVYFVQKQGFLDGDVDYLRNRLGLVQISSKKRPMLLQLLTMSEETSVTNGSPQDLPSPSSTKLTECLPSITASPRRSWTSLSTTTSSTAWGGRGDAVSALQLESAKHTVNGAISRDSLSGIRAYETIV